MAWTSSSSSRPIIEVEVKTWARETHNLFDFEAKDTAITHQNFDIGDSVTFVRDATGKESTVSVVSFPHPVEDGEKLIQIEWRQGNFTLNRPRWGSTDDRRIQRCWQLIRGSDEAADGGHRLAVHDIIKFGRSQFKVRQLSTIAQGVALDDGSSICKVDPSEFDSHKDKVCRICLFEGSTMEDPLLAPCKCRGSIQHVHLGCLKHWVKDRLGLDNGTASFMVGGSTSPLCCELCKSAYQTTVQIGQKKLPLVDVDTPFLVLESCNDHRLHVLPIETDKPLKIGRGHECNMNIHDTSISRVQASIELNDGNFVLKDRGSRFGTYVKITKPLNMEVGKQFSVQVGRSILQLTTKLVSGVAQNATLEPLRTQMSQSSQGEEAPDTDIHSSESPRGKGSGSSGRSSSDLLQHSHSSPAHSEEFLSCDGC